MIKVFHFDHRRASHGESHDVFTGVKTPDFHRHSYHLVANMDIPDAEYGDVFRLTNHIDQEWWFNNKVEAIGVPRYRSTSIGDVIELSDGRRLICRPVGWEEI